MTQVTPPADRSTPRPTRREVLERHLPEADRRLVRTVDGLADADWDAPSLLPGWTRAHVAAHLALNAEGLAAALGGVVTGEPVPMYRTPEARDDDIAELAAAGPAELRSRLLAAGPVFAEAAAAVPDDAADVVLERTPGDRRFRAGDVAWMRWREVEIHHADLAAGYGPQDWSPAFAAHLLGAMAGRGAAGTAFSAYASDLDATWTVGAAGGAADDPTGEGTPVVTGTAAALAWWLTGRGTGEGLTCESGELPRIGAW
jgi:maleylpyruvate isomerase